MVKRIFGSLMLVLIATVSILAQIDYNKQIKNLPPITQGNLANIRIVDGLKFAKSAAGINAADADLGDPFNTGEIWIPATQVTATDTQISISPGHKLRIFGTLLIDAVNKGPILLGSGASITCVPAPDNAANIQQSGAGTVPSMIRLTAQDGSQTTGIVIEGCDIFAGVNPVTNGVIDATGSLNRGWIRDSKIRGFTSGWGIFIQDNQTGVVAGTNSLQIQNNLITASNTAGCITITHSATNASLLFVFDILDTYCASGPSSTVAPIRINNISTAGNQIRQVNITNAFISSIPGGVPGINLNGVFQSAIRHISCYGSASGSGGCVNITSNAQSGNITVDNLETFFASNNTALVDGTFGSAVISGSNLGHYDALNNSYTGTVTAANFNNIRIVDGFRFPQSAAGINAADADLGNTPGEIWVPSPTITATDAQISIGAKHTLKVFGQLTIEASASKGPILLGNAAGLVCADANTAIQEATTGATMTSMVRLTANDGSQAGNFIERCQFFANSAATVSNGIIDISGFRQGWIRDVLINFYNSGWGIFAQDIQSGVLGGTNNVQIMNNQIFASGTGGCIEILHSATNAVTLNSFNIVDNNCFVGASSGNSVLIQNTSPQASFLRQVSVQNLYIAGTPAAQNAFVINGVQQGSFRNITCAGGSSAICVQIASNTNNGLINVENVITYSGNNALSDSLNSVNILTGVTHYTFSANTNSYDYFPAVSYLKVVGLAPTASATGCGTGCTVTVQTASTNNAGKLILNTGTTPGTFGTLTLTFNSTQVTTFAPNGQVCVIATENAASGWPSQSSVDVQSSGLNQTIFAWSTNSTALTASQSNAYAFDYVCIPK